MLLSFLHLEIPPSWMKKRMTVFQLLLIEGSLCAKTLHSHPTWTPDMRKLRPREAE